MKILVSVPDTLVKAADEFIDGKNFRHRSQLISVVLADWIAREKYPEVRHANAYAEAAAASQGGGSSVAIAIDGTVTNRYEARNIMRKHLLGDDWNKHQHANALVFEEDESGEMNRQVRELERNQEALESRIAALEAIIQQTSGQLATQPEEPKDEKSKKPGGESTKPQEGS
jgi:Arc/MetJ-type ribon-helix-helix transcriptional regulator